MIDFSSFLQRQEFQPWVSRFEQAIERRTNPRRHGDLTDWLASLERLPQASPSIVSLNEDTITIGQPNDLSVEEQVQLHSALLSLAPWRKGPYQFFSSFVDTEWRSDWKWQRLQPHISDLSGRIVLDVGCGTGYHCWRMLGAGADYVLGIDPSMRFLVQYLAAQKYLRDRRFDFLPVGIEDMPTDMAMFDSVFSMGVIYHRRNPINHLLELKHLLKSGGELILETLIVDEAENGLLRPEGRYAMMRNVWSLMTPEKLVELLQEAGFEQPRCVDKDVTSLDEQRRTEWMQFHSLEQFLDPLDRAKTIEGHPAPKRGIFIARKQTM
ncbi:MAG: tRNA 5-methoxyuridine(34)/uridine 5-oxyacetic acid(34) synthase CmoB [Pseudomonadota bacterium]